MTIRLNYASTRAALSLVQLALPHYQDTIRKVQNCATLFDAGMLVWDYKETHDQFPTSTRPMFRTVFVGGLIGVVSTLATIVLNPKRGNGLQKVMQWIALIRFFVNLYMGLNTAFEQRRPLLVAALQGITCCNLYYLGKK